MGEKLNKQHDEIVKKLMFTVSRFEFIKIGFRYNLVCVATTSSEINIYLVPYTGGTSIITRYPDGHINQSRVGAEVAQMLVDLGVNFNYGKAVFDTRKTPPITYADAMTVVCNELNIDREPGSIYHSWQSNLAMVIADTLNITNSAANATAKDFLEKLIDRGEKGDERVIQKHYIQDLRHVIVWGEPVNICRNSESNQNIIYYYESWNDRYDVLLCPYSESKPKGYTVFGSVPCYLAYYKKCN